MGVQDASGIEDIPICLIIRGGCQGCIFRQIRRFLAFFRQIRRPFSVFRQNRRILAFFRRFVFYGTGVSIGKLHGEVLRINTLR